MQGSVHKLKKSALKKLVSRNEESNILAQIMALAGHGIAIYDVDGSLIAGVDEAVAERTPVEIDGDTIGWVSGGEHALKVSAFLQYIYLKETQRTAIVKDALEKYKELTFLYRITEKIAACLDIKELARLVIDEARRVLKADSASLMMLNEQSGALDILHAWGKESAPKLGMKRGEGIAGAVMLAGRAEIINDVPSDPRFIAGRNAVCSMLCVPLANNDRVFGVLNVSCENRHEYLAEDLNRATTLAFQAAMAIENARYVTELRESEHNYRTMFEKYHSLFENAVEGIFQASPGGNFINANPAMANILGYASAEELLSSLTDAEAQLYASPEDHGKYQRNLVETGRVANFETQFYRKDRSRIWVSLSSHAIHEQGKLLFYEGSVIDISERKGKEEAEQRNRHIREVFGRYLSDEIVNNLFESPGGLKLGGEKRVVTILMSDLRGFTSIGEMLPAEDVVGMINIYLGVMIEIILKYNGTIDEIIGDAILIIFGAPVQREDDPVRAVACAVEMQVAMAEVNRINREAGYPEVAMGMGINTGSVVVGNIGSKKRTKYAVVGRNVNLTSRIESYTVGGQILASQSTIEACRGMVRIGSNMEVMPKGSQEPITLYEVGGIGGDYNLYLPEKKRVALPELQQPIPVRFNLLDGKDVIQKSFHGRILRMSDTEAEIDAEVIADKLSNIRISLAGTGSPEIYAKVMEHVSTVPPAFRVCLTSAATLVQDFMKAAQLSGKNESPVKRN